MAMPMRCQIRTSVLLPFLLLLWGAPPLQGQEVTARGVVYADLNQNGSRDAGEPGLAGILVSNQRDVVRTGVDGSFALPVEPGMVVYVHQPPDHRVPVDALNLPRFSYVHEPQGSPPLRHGGMYATGPLPDRLEFGLIPAEKELDFQVVIFGDPQPRDHREVDFIRDDAVGEIAGTGAAFALVLGDAMYDDLSLFPRYNQVMAAMGMPLWNAVGNHDIDFDAGGNRHGRDTFRSHFGANHYSFEYGDVLFLMLDNIDYLGYNDVGRRSYRGMLREQQLQWIGNVLREVPEDRLVVLGMHIPLFAWGGETPNVNTGDREELFRILSGRRVLALTGHIHMIYHHLLGEEVGWSGPDPFHQLTAATLSGTWWGGPEDERGIPVATQRDGTPNGYHLLSFQGSHYRERFKGLGFDADAQLRVEFPAGEVSADSIRGRDLLVNVFSGSAGNVVEAQVNSGPWFPLENTSGPSPFFEALLTTRPETFGENITAIPTNHLWRGSIPEALLEPGVHRIRVRTVDLYGVLHEGSGVLEVR
jgi:hypothetical protein